MWIALALLAALGSAATSASLKQTVGFGGLLVSIVVFRLVAGVLLLGVVMATGTAAPLTAEYWRAVALVMVPEVAGTVLMTLALREGDLSLVKPILGFTALFVLIGGIVALGEVPTWGAGIGIVLVSLGVYWTGLKPGESRWEPIRALAYTKASRYAIATAFFFGITTVVHRLGVDAVGAFPWAATLALGSGVSIALLLPFLPKRPAERSGVPAGGSRMWMRLVALTGGLFAVQQVGLHLAIARAPVSYVMALGSTSTLIAAFIGVFWLGERDLAPTRLIGAAIVTVGAALVALLG